MASIEKIEGIGGKYGAKLAKDGIKTTEKLLKAGATAKGRKEIAKNCGINDTVVLRCVNMADLFRIKGVAEEYADLLEAAGVDTVPELAQRNAANLHAKMLEVNEKKKLVRRPPAATVVEDWIAQAKKLPRVIEY